MIGEFKPYPEYKDSGVGWMREVPEDWKVRKLRSVLRSTATRNRPELPLLSVVREKGVIVRDVSSQESNHNFIPDDLSNYKVVHKGQFAMNKMKAWQGSYGVSRYEGIVSPAYYVFDLKNMSGEFFNVAIRSKAYVPCFTQASDGVRIGQWDLSQNRMREIPFLIPPTNEQYSIVRFLNYIDRRIQKYIRAKKKLIKLLEEQKQAIINQVVTKGLNPDVKMKPSGIEWLGEIPEHWECSRLKYLTKESIAGPYGSSLTMDVYTPDGYKVYGQQQVIPDDLTVGNYYISLQRYQSMERYSIREGDLLISVVGTAGCATVVPVEFEPGIINPRLVLYRLDRDLLLPRYAKLFIRSSLCQNQLTQNAGGATMMVLNMKILGNMCLTLPSLEEQSNILSHCSNYIQLLNRTSRTLNSQISSIQEYRTRLISDVVTGKIDVREISAQLPEEDEDAEVPELDDALNEVIEDVENSLKDDG